MLEAQGARFSVACFWGADVSQGGPALTARQMRELAELHVDQIWWDLYYAEDRLRAGLVDEDGERVLLIVGDRDAFGTVGARLRRGRSQQIIGRIVALRFDRMDAESVPSCTRPDTNVLQWTMRPDEMIRVADQFEALARALPSLRLELVPERNEAGIRIVASSGEYDWHDAPFDQDQ